MLRSLTHRITITTLNILLPPLAVLLICGPGWDIALNCILFICAVVPSHIHGVYLSIVYFHRRHKVGLLQRQDLSLDEVLTTRYR